MLTQNTGGVSMTANNPLLSSAMKRLSREAAEMQEADEYIHAQPVEENLFEWHFTIRGQSDSDFAEGIYHGRLIFPSNYPLSPPEIIMMTPNGVFETDRKICLSISSYHPETWLPSWSIRTGLLALIGFMPNCPEGVLGHIKRTSEERRFLALQSVDYHCPTCFTTNKDVLKQRSCSNANVGKETDRVGENESQSGLPECSRDVTNGRQVDSARLQSTVTSTFVMSQRDSQSGATLSSFLTSTLAVVFIFFLMRNVYLWTNPPLDF